MAFTAKKKTHCSFKLGKLNKSRHPFCSATN